MAQHSTIEWTDATWNPITGCSVVSPGCTNCYAMKLAGTRLAQHPSRAGLTRDSKAGPVWTGEVRFNEQWLTQPLQWKRPRMIFVCAHADLFHDNVPDAWIDRVFAVMALAPKHTFQVLTKRSKRMREYLLGLNCDGVRRLHIAAAAGRLMEDGDNACDTVANGPWPLPNVWIGVSVEDQTRADERIPDLLATPAAVRWISAEPLLGPVNVSPWLKVPARCEECDSAGLFGGRDHNCPPGACPNDNGGASIDWVVAGGESGPGARPMHPDCARSLRDQCAAAGVAFHFKQWGEWAPHTRDIENHNGDIVTTPKGEPGWRAYVPGGISGSFRVGKKAAGRLLDGVEHNGLPEVRS